MIGKQLGRSLGSYGAENVDNADMHGVADSFCDYTAVLGQVIRYWVGGYLLDRMHAGRVFNWISACAGGSPGPTQRETLIRPYLPTGAKPSSWGKLKVRYR